MLNWLRIEKFNLNVFFARVEFSVVRMVNPRRFLSYRVLFALCARLISLFNVECFFVVSQTFCSCICVCVLFVHLNVGCFLFDFRMHHFFCCIVLSQVRLVTVV